MRMAWFGDGRPVKVRVRRPPPKALTVALDEQTLNRLKRIARHKQVLPRHLAAMWIAERLTQERPTENGNSFDNHSPRRGVRVHGS